VLDAGRLLACDTPEHIRALAAIPANKIGTYQIAVLARENDVPFYVAAPISTLDLAISSGEQIPIEERAAEEVTHIRGISIAPEVELSRSAAWHGLLFRIHSLP